MRGPRTLTDLAALMPRGRDGWFFAGYALFVLIQYPISRSWPAAWSFYGLLLPAAVLYAARQRQRLMAILRDPVVQAFLLLFAYTVFHALFFTPVYEGIGKTLLNTADTTLFFLCSVAFFADAGRPFLHRFFLVLSLLVVTCAMASIVLNYLHPSINERLAPIGRTQNSMLGAYTYALAGIASIYQYHLSRSARTRLYYLAVTLLVGGMIVLTKTRMAMLNYTLVALLLHCAYSRSARPAARFALAAAAAFALALILIPGMPHDVMQYAAGLWERKDARRMELWGLDLRSIRQHPLLGVGMRSMLNINLYGHQHPIGPHSLYLGTAYYLGLPGLALFLYPLYLSAKRGAALFLAGDAMGILAAGLLLMGMVATTTDFGQFVKTPGPLWLIFWLPVAFVIGTAISRRREAA